MFDRRALLRQGGGNRVPSISAPQTPTNSALSWSEIRAAVQSLGDEDVARLLGDVLGRRRTSLAGAKRDRARIVGELAFVQRLDAHVQRHLNLLAEVAYDGRHPKHWLWRSHKQFFLDRLRPGDRVLDIGCGASAYLLWMAELGCRVTAWDINPARIQHARELMSHPNLMFEVRDVTTRPQTGDGRFDAAICSHVIEHLDDPVPVLSALRAHADWLMVAVPPDDNRWQKVMYRDLGLPWKDDEDHRREYTPELLREQLNAAGWQVNELHAGVDIKAVCTPTPRPISAADTNSSSV